MSRESSMREDGGTIAAVAEKEQQIIMLEVGAEATKNNIDAEGNRLSSSSSSLTSSLPADRQQQPSSRSPSNATSSQPSSPHTRSATLSRPVTTPAPAPTTASNTTATTPAATTTRAPWSAPTHGHNAKNQGGRTSLADIMAEQTEDRRAAQIAYGASDVSLAQQEREQERLMRQYAKPHYNRQDSAVSLDFVTEEEERQLRLALEKSKLDFKRPTHDSEEDATSLSPQQPPRQRIIKSRKPGSRAASMRDLNRSASRRNSIESLSKSESTLQSPKQPVRQERVIKSRKTGGSPSLSQFFNDRERSVPNSPVRNIDTDCRSESALGLMQPPRLRTGLGASPSQPIRSSNYYVRSSSSHSLSKLSTSRSRPTLNDREFSERTMRVIERTEIVIDNPHADALARRRRLQKSGSARLSTKNATPQDFADRERAQLMQQASKHISAREIKEIDQALGGAGNMSFPTMPNIGVRRSRSIEQDPSFRNQLSHDNANLKSPPSPQPHRANPRSKGSPLPLSPTLASNRRRTFNPAGSPPTLPADIQSAVPTRPPPTTRTPGSSLPPPPPVAAATKATTTAANAQAASLDNENTQGFLSEDEAAAIEKALREADREEEEKSLLLALQMQEEEMNNSNTQIGSNRSPAQKGNIRTMTRAQLDAESLRVGAIYQTGPIRQHPLEQQDQSHRIGAVQQAGPPTRHPLEENASGASPAAAARANQQQDASPGDAGFRINSNRSQEWQRRDRNTIVGPNGEIRTKHDTELQALSNAQMLGVEEFGIRAHVGNKTYNSFQKSMKRTSKGVASHGTGRAGSDVDATKGKVMNSDVHQNIMKAVNKGLINRCNGRVKEGKEAVVFHADQGDQSEGFDVAVKVFKRIEEFKSRGDYVNGDRRYAGKDFGDLRNRDRLHLWAEKEFRNLVRAERAQVPVPSPLHYKDNIVFMRFLGDDCRPAPQLRELELRHGSSKWDNLYTQVMEGIRRLYAKAGLVHADLSEYNILVVPSEFVKNNIICNDTNGVQAVLIDFGQAVDRDHPDARELLRRDLGQVRQFFNSRGAKTLSLDDAMNFVLESLATDSNNNNNDDNNSSRRGERRSGAPRYDDHVPATTHAPRRIEGANR